MFFHDVDVLDQHLTVVVGRNCRTQSRVIDNPSAVQVTQEFLDLVDRDCVAYTNVDAPSLFERAATIDPDELA